MRFFLVDAFVTDVPFSGNPAGVAILDRDVDEAWMQAFAAEVNQAETAFLRPDYQLRWFTPTVEVDLCGHATLATAHALGVTEPVEFMSRSGPLGVCRVGDALELNFPAEEPHPDEDPFVHSLFPDAVWVGRNRMDWFVQVPDADSVRAFSNPGAVEELGMRGLLLTAPGEGEMDVVSRFFAPQSGILEDPVTGSAHCALGPFWSPRLGKTTLCCEQLSRRGGVVEVETCGARVKLRGKCRTVVTGEIG